MDKAQSNRLDDDALEKTWRVYVKTRDPALKEKLILHYVYLVKLVAGRLRIHIGTHVEYEDMVSYGIFGLIDAVEKYDSIKGVKFDTYASLRIRGSIIDSLRKMDWVPRNLRQKNKEVSRVYAELEAELGREPTDEELAEKLDCPPDKVDEFVRKSSVATLISLDDYMSQSHNRETGFAEAGASGEDDPENVLSAKEQARMLAEAISKLGDKEKKVMSLYYFDELTLKEISAIMRVSESRVSQIHSKAILKLRGKLERTKSFFV